MDESVREYLPEYLPVPEAVHLLEDKTSEKWPLSKLKAEGINFYFLVPAAWAHQLSTKRDKPPGAYWAEFDPLDHKQLWATTDAEDKLYPSLIKSPEGTWVHLLGNTMSLQRKDLRIQTLELKVALEQAMQEAAENVSHLNATTTQLAPVVPGLTKEEVLTVFVPLLPRASKSSGEMAAKFGKQLASPRKWLAECRVEKGLPGSRSSRWNPVLLGVALVEKKRISLKRLDAEFQTSTLLAPWLTQWETFKP